MRTKKEKDKRERENQKAVEEFNKEQIERNEMQYRIRRNLRIKEKNENRKR